jgi:hypothetical protein
MRNPNKLTIRWQRLLAEGQTCPRCRTTETEVEKAVALLTQSLGPLDIEIILEKKALSVEEFKQDFLQSNMIWLNDRTLEDWLGGKTGQSQCCDVCGPDDCRTVGVGDKVYETIPAELLVQAGLLAAARLLGKVASSGDSAESREKSRCCPE